MKEYKFAKSIKCVILNVVKNLNLEIFRSAQYDRKNKRKNLNAVIITMMFLFTVSLNAQQNITLEESISIALKENLNIKVAKNNNEAANNNIHIGNAGLLPKVDLTGSTTYNDNELNNNGIISNQSFTNNSAGVRASYTLFDGLNNIATYDRLKTLGSISDYQTRNIVEQNIIQVTNSFYDVATKTDQLSIAKESLEISNERLERTENKKEYGQAKSIEYLSALVDFNRDSVAYINANTLLIQAKQNFNNLLNREINFEFDVNLNVFYKSIPERDELINIAQERNASYKATVQNIEYSEANVKIANSNFLPKLTLDANYNYNNSQNELSVNLDDKNRNFSTSLTMSYNLFNGFRNSIQKQNAEIDLKNSELEKNKELLNLITQISNSFQKYENSKVSLKLENDNLESAELNFNRSKELYNMGTITTTQFRESQLNLVQAKSNISSLKYSVKMNEAELEQLAGILLESNK